MIAMIRKQIYLEAEQDAHLKQLREKRGNQRSRLSVRRSNDICFRA
jgi:hypothetical protein